jgi:superoxide dismutase, Fe-Mn family
MKPHVPRKFENLAGFEGLSERSLREHYRLYEGYVAKYNSLMAKLRSIQAVGNIHADSDSESLKVDITFALGAIKNHELYFEILGNDGDEPEGALAEEIAKSFHSVPQYLVDLKQTALMGRGWAWTAYDLDGHYLFNYEGGAHNGLPVWNSVPIVAIDLYGHAYFYDYGNNKVAYVEAAMKAISWTCVAKRLAAIKARHGH